MANLELSLAVTPYDRVQPLITGEVKPEGITLRYEEVPLQEIWHRQLQKDEFDVSEMSFSFFLRGRPLGWGYRMLPVFHNRNFSYTRIVVRGDAGVRPDHPEDLRGKRVGVTDYQMTAALWARGILQHEFGLRPEDVEWFQGREPPPIPGETSSFRPPTGVTLRRAPKSLEVMLQEGELDAAFAYGSSIGASGAIQPLFPDTQGEAVRFYRKNQVYPPHHVTIVRESIVQEHPWVAASLLEAFDEAKALAAKRLYDRPPSLLVFGGEWLKEQRDIFGDDPYVNGLAPNAAALDMVQTFSAEQGLTARKQPLEEMLPAELLTA